MNTFDNASYCKSTQSKEIRNQVTSNNLLDEFSVSELIIIFWKGKYLVIAFIVLSTVSGIIYALLAPEQFTTTSYFITKTGRSSPSGGIGQLASLANLSLVSSGNADPSDYLDKIIQDKQFILKLFDHRWFYQEDTLPLETILKINKDTLSANWQHIYMMSKVEAIRKNGLLKIRKDTKTGVLALTSKMPDPRLTHDINLFTLDFISNFIRNSIQTQAKEKRLFIEEQLKKVKAELQKSENNLTEYKERNIMSQTPRSMLEEARLLRQVNLNQEIYLQYHKQYELVRVEELDDQTLIQVLKNPEIPILRSEPKRKIIVVIAFIIGTIAGLISVILFNYAPKFSYWMKADSNYNSNLKV